jgi:uncharacterized protein (TIGR00730 family)
MKPFLPENRYSITVYCGSTGGIRPQYLEAACQMGQALGEAGIELVYGAGKTGIMGAVADGALQAGGRVTGVVPAHLNTPALIHGGLTRLELVDNMHQRKARMYELGDAFIALPGGYGTMEELFEILTWAQLGLHQKPIGLLNVLGYYNPLLQLISHMLGEGFIYEEHPTLLLSADTPKRLLDMIGDFKTPDNIGRWVNRE